MDGFVLAHRSSLCEHFGALVSGGVVGVAEAPYRDVSAVIDTEFEYRIGLPRFPFAPITVAILGCAVNGPGEAREADVGIAGAQPCRDTTSAPQALA